MTRSSLPPSRRSTSGCGPRSGERQEHRGRIAKLAAGDSLALPPEAVAYLEQLRSLGVSERMIEGERDGWILLAAHSPDQMALWMESKFQQLKDPEVIALYRTFEDLVEWAPDDPRLPALADRLAANIAATDLDQQDGELTIPAELIELARPVLPAARFRPAPPSSGC
ncbi:hypothetical protein [Aeromicrobium sp. UC242_57]|uniref:hypothetical protein n=1 Tax=Aeromicrobium sp. UC242_57 TaxID=3374624 RepID=UPI00379B263F